MFDPGYYTEKKYRDAQRAYYDSARLRGEQLRHNLKLYLEPPHENKRWYKRPGVLSILAISGFFLIRVGWMGVQEYRYERRAQILQEVASRELYHLSSQCLDQAGDFRDIIQCVHNEASAESKLVDILNCSSAKDAYFSISGTSFKHCQNSAASIEGKEACRMAREKGQQPLPQWYESQCAALYHLAEKDLLTELRSTFRK